MSRRTAGAVAAAAVLVTAILLAVLTRSAGAGPFAWPGDAGSTWIGLPVKSGQFGVTTLTMPRTLTAPAVLLDVRPLHPEDATGLILRYAATIGRRGLEIGGARGWNMRPRQLQPLPGFVIPAHARGGVTIGAESKRRGVYMLRGFVVDYRIGGTRYSAPMQFGFELCVGMRTCPSDG